MAVTEVPTAARPIDDGPATVDPEAVAAAIVGARPGLSIAEVADALGITAHTLRYYERAGLLAVPRDEAGRRRYTVREVTRLVVITRLRSTAMPMLGIQEYFRLVDEGPATMPQRLALLEAHRSRVLDQLAELRSALAVIDFKIDLYAGTSRQP
ncbi:MAG TPA: MerR family transcriptional regulator [Acidimicrobiales bacterium]